MKKIGLIFILMVYANHITAQVERDKALHFVGGTLYGLVGAGVAKQISDGDRYWTFAGAVGGSFLVGLAKESIDKKQYGGWDNDDLLATVLGGMSVGFTIDVFTNKKRKKRKSDYTTNYDPVLLKETGTNSLASHIDGTPTLNMLSVPSSLLK